MKYNVPPSCAYFCSVRKANHLPHRSMLALPGQATTPHTIHSDNQASKTYLSSIELLKHIQKFQIEIKKKSYFMKFFSVSITAVGPCASFCMHVAPAPSCAITGDLTAASQTGPPCCKVIPSLNGDVGMQGAAAAGVHGGKHSA